MIILFKSTTEFEAALLEALKTINNEESIIKWAENNGHDDIELNDIIEEALSQGLVNGIKPRLGIGGDLTISENSPRLTYAGLGYLEKNDDED